MQAQDHAGSFNRSVEVPDCTVSGSWGLASLLVNLLVSAIVQDSCQTLVDQF